MDKVNKDYRYSAEHEWVDSSTPAKVGLSQIAVDALGDVVYVDLPEAGTTVTAGEVCGEVESTKSVSEIYSPVTGTVVEANDAVVDDPAMLNSDPYGQAWLFTVEVESEGELLTPEEYAAAQDDED
ncbi:glycine cleavage system protein GcvH [Kocuria sp. JC486]|uniref:Glycine cleavage system H protein n=1 Tax=Kocuria soli TaxID=2485125 RepID=A0A3N3ZQ18_9MICC|nr:glycine cleavage system protein GcvH [Kocuria soli]NHU86109.1 glycine cleavage system protein GcvH [Kocuria sp. JC486]ROZ62237.1 glycine cleavage system protein GcvH [Kocuria soli]